MAPMLSTALLRTQTDDRLAALAMQGHERAFEAIVERYRRPLHGYCRRMLSPERAEDVVQQVFLNAWSAMQRGTEVSDLRAWLYRIAHNAAVNAYRAAGYDYDELRESLTAPATSEVEHERRAIMRETLTGLAALPERQREALLRIAVEGRTHEEVARELGVSGGAVRQLVHRARLSMRAAATALTPLPLVQWLAGLGAGGQPAAARIAEVAAGGGAVGVSAALAKSGAVVLTAGSLAAGGAAMHEPAASADRGTERGEAAGQRHERKSEARVAVAASESGERRSGRRGRHRGRGRDGEERGERHGDRRGRGQGRGRGGDDGGSHGGHGRSGGGDDRSRSGPSGGDDGGEQRSRNRGSGGGGTGDDTAELDAPAVEDDARVWEGSPDTSGSGPSAGGGSGSGSSGGAAEGSAVAEDSGPPADSAD